MILVLRRGVATRAKKVPVQLLKDWPRLGKRGEVVEVSEGLMRNKLHAQNGAAYVLKGEPLRIPIYIRPDIQASVPKIPVEKSTPTQKHEDELSKTEEKQPKQQPSVIDFLKFPGSEAKSDSQDPTAQPEAAEESQKFEWENEIVANISKNRRS